MISIRKEKETANLANRANLLRTRERSWNGLSVIQIGDGVELSGSSNLLKLFQCADCPQIAVAAVWVAMTPRCSFLTSMVGISLLVFREEEEVPSEQRRGRSGVGEFAFGFRNGASESLGGFHPLGDDDLGVGDGFFVGGSVGHAAGEFGDFHEEGLIFLAPVDDEFVAHVSRCRVGV